MQCENLQILLKLNTFTDILEEFFPGFRQRSSLAQILEHLLYRKSFYRKLWIWLHLLKKYLMKNFLYSVSLAENPVLVPFLNLGWSNKFIISVKND